MPQHIEDIGTEEASPEQQQQYELIVNNAIKFMHKSEASASIDNQLKQAEQRGIPETVGMLAAQLTVQQLEAAKNSGVQPDPDAALQASSEIVEELVETGMAEGFFTFQDEAMLESEQERAAVLAQQHIQQVAAKMQLFDVEQLRRDSADLIRQKGAKGVQGVIGGIDGILNRGAPAQGGQGLLASEAENG